MPESTLSALGLLSNLPTLDETYGALLLGTFAGLILYGVFLHQAYRYARVYAKDHLTNKSFVLCVVLVDTVHNIVSMHACYAYLVNNYFNPLALLRGIWSIQIQPLLAGFAVLTCQSFFARRVYILNTKHRVLVALSVLLTCITMAFAIAGTVIAFKYHTFAQYEHFYWIDSAACGAAIASDSLTASVLIWTLRRSRTGFRQTDTLLNTLILYTINTGLLTGVVNTLALVFALARPNSMVWIALETVAVRLYTNSVLAVLNSRKSLSEERERSGPLELDLELRSVPRTENSSRLEYPTRASESIQKSNVPQWGSGVVIHIAEEHHTA